MILVSHDRALLEAVGSRTVVCEGGTLESHMSGWAEYQRARDEREALEREQRQAAAVAARPPGAGSRGGAGSQVGRAGREDRPSGPSKNAIRKIATIERDIARAEQKLREIEDELADPAAWSSPGRAQRAGERHEAAKQEIQDLYERLEQAEVRSPRADRRRRPGAVAATAFVAGCLAVVGLIGAGCGGDGDETAAAGTDATTAASPVAAPDPVAPDSIGFDDLKACGDQPGCAPGPSTRDDRPPVRARRSVARRDPDPLRGPAA